jgi:hypothetical protein
MCRSATIASPRTARATIYSFLARFRPTILPLFYDHALRWASENLPGFFGKEPRQLADFEGLLFERTIPFDQNTP